MQSQEFKLQYHLQVILIGRLVEVPGKKGPENGWESIQSKSEQLNSMSGMMYVPKQHLSPSGIHCKKQKKMYKAIYHEN